MKANKTVKGSQTIQGKDLTVDPRKSFNIQIEYNVPFSKLNPRIEKENIGMNQMQSLEERTLKEEEDAFAREQAKKNKADTFFKKVQESSKQLMQQKKKDKQVKDEEKRKEQERIMMKTSKPRSILVKKSPKKKNISTTENPFTESLLEDAMESKENLEHSVSQDISNLSFMNPETALQRNEIIRNHMASLAKRVGDQSSINILRSDFENKC